MSVPPFHPLAEEEMNAGADYYEGRTKGVGRKFVSAVLSTAEALRADPHIGSPAGPPVRSFPLRRFPYSLYYEPTEDGILILAVAHHRRRPGYWRSRR
jgi:plasmid stabilization system protein ParE